MYSLTLWVYPSCKPFALILVGSFEDKEIQAKVKLSFLTENQIFFFKNLTLLKLIYNKQQVFKVKQLVSSDMCIICETIAIAY